MHLQFTLHEASYLVRQKTVEVLNKHEFPVSSALGDTHKQVSRKALNALIKGFLIALKIVLLLGHRLETAQRTTGKGFPAKYICSFELRSDRHRDFPDVSRSQSIVLSTARIGYFWLHV